MFYRIENNNLKDYADYKYFLDELAKGFGITPNQLDKIFGGQ